MLENFGMIIAVVKMKIVVVSDSHGRDEALEYVLKQHPDADAYIHCGDIEAEEGLFPSFLTVRGNNDLFCDYPDERVVPAGVHRIFVVHSHQFIYSKRSEKMAEAAKERGCDIVCYGHTHVANDETVDGVRLINPGSLWRSRDGRGPSYAILTIDGDDIDVVFEFLPQKQKQKKSRFFW